jgi:hypothetical protein
VPIWLDRVDAQRLMDAVESSHAANVNTLAFLCESRTYVLNEAGSNAEAEEMLVRAGSGGPAIGIYLNGEFSTGSRQRNRPGTAAR